VLQEDWYENLSKSPKNFPAKMRVDLAKFAIKLKLDLMTRIRRNIAIFKANKYVKRHEGGR